MEDFRQKKCFFWQETVFFLVKNIVSWAISALLRGHVVYIAYYTEFNLQICDYAQKRRICRGNSKDVPDENFCGHFCPRRKAANFCHPGDRKMGGGNMELYLNAKGTPILRLCSPLQEQAQTKITY